jgi:hypothetical protein
MNYDRPQGMERNAIVSQTKTLLALHSDKFTSPDAKYWIYDVLSDEAVDFLNLNVAAYKTLRARRKYLAAV